MTKKLGLILAVILLTTLLGCEVVCPPCPECPPPEVTCYPAEVTVTPEVNVECPEPDVTVEVTVEPEIEPPDVIVRPQVDVYVTVAPDYSEPRLREKHLEIIVENYMRLHSDLYNHLRLKELRCTYDGLGIWTILCKMQNPPPSPYKQGNVYWHKLVVDEGPPVKVF